MRIKGWYRFFSLILCLLFFIHNIYAMMINADAITQAALLLSRACLGLNACRTRTDLSYIQEYLDKHQINTHKNIYSDSKKSWEYLQLVSDTNKLLIPCGYTITYDVLSHTPTPAPTKQLTVAASVSIEPLLSTPTHADSQASNACLLQPFNPAIQSAITFKNPYEQITPEQASCFRPQMKLNKSNYDHFNDYQAAYNLRARHIEDACRQNKAYKQYFIDCINATIQHFLDCNSDDMLTRLDARLNTLTAIAECSLDPPFEFVSQNAAYEFIARYFDGNGALVTIEDDPELLWSIRTLANTRLCGSAYGYWAIVNTQTESDWNLIVHNVSAALSNLCRGIRCATGLVPTPNTIWNNKDNVLLREIIQWCKQENWDLVVHDHYHRPSVADNPEFICKCIKLLRQQNLNKYKINKLADEDPLWQSLSEQTKKLATNSPEKRQLLSLYFRLRHDLRAEDKNPDDLEISLLVSATIQQADTTQLQKRSQQQRTRRQRETSLLNKSEEGASSEEKDENATPDTNQPEEKIDEPEQIKEDYQPPPTLSSFTTEGTNENPYQQPPTPPQSPSTISNAPGPEENKSNNYRPDNPHKLTKEQWNALMKLFKKAKDNLPKNFSPDELQKFIAELLAEIKKIWPECPINDINLRHIFEGESKKYRGVVQLTGYHATNWCNQVKNVTQSVCNHGVYEAIWTFMGLIKKSSMFPDSWNSGLTIIKIMEAYIKQNDRITRGENIFISGVVKEGIGIGMWISNGIVTTAYPFIKGIYSCCTR